MNIFRYFNHRKYLSSRGIKFKDSGENIGRSWVGIYECPYCNKPNYHFGMHTKYKTLNCWVCETKKTLPAYIMKTDHCDYDDAIKIIIQFSDNIDFDFDEDDYKREFAKSVVLPSGLQKTLSDSFLDFLEDRGFSDPEFISEKYKLMCTNAFSEIPSRLIFPFFYNDDMVTFIHRTINKKGYRNWAIEKSILDVKSTLYNIDSVKDDTIVLCEGVFDVIKGGDSFVGTSGIEYTSEQVSLILSKKPKRIFIVFDPEAEAQKQAKKLMATLSLFCEDIQNIFLTTDDDLGNMSEKDVRHFRKELGV